MNDHDKLAKLEGHLCLLIAMWDEAAHLCRSNGLVLEAAVMHMSIRDLEGILNGDVSCIEVITETIGVK